MFQKIIELKLKFFAKLILARYRPKIVVVTGNIGKTSTKEAIYSVLKDRFYCRRSEKSYNNSLGLPLTILGQSSAGRSFFGWAKIFWEALGLFVFYRRYPKILILEMGADEPGGIKNLVDFIPADVGVVTAIGEIPVHIEFFKDRNQLVQEKEWLIKSLKKEGRAILHYDSESVKKMAQSSRAPVIFYGLSQTAGLYASDINFGFEVGNLGVKFKLNFNGNSIPVKVDEIIGRHQLYPILAAAAVAIHFGMNLVEISEALSKFQAPPGRLRIIKGINRSIIFDDSYNASPTPVIVALETLGQFKNKRKVVVLGDMTELGKYTQDAHKKVGERAARAADCLCLVGKFASITSDAAEKAGLSREKIRKFVNSAEAAEKIPALIGQNDIILVKGSQAVRLEKVVKSLMAEPGKAQELLVRQDKFWQK